MQPGFPLAQLLAVGADVDCRDRHGTTPLMLAGNRDIAAVLIDAGADVKLRSWHGGTALDKARQHKDVEMISLLTGAARRQEATMLLNWMLAMAPLELPICEYCVTRIVY